MTGLQPTDFNWLIGGDGNVYEGTGWRVVFDPAGSVSHYLAAALFPVFFNLTHDVDVESIFNQLSYR